VKKYVDNSQVNGKIQMRNKKIIIVNSIIVLMIIMLIISICLLIKLMREKMKFLTILDIIFRSLYRFIRIYTEIPQKITNFYEQSNVKTYIYLTKTRQPTIIYSTIRHQSLVYFILWLTRILWLFMCCFLCGTVKKLIPYNNFNKKKWNQIRKIKTKFIFWQATKNAVFRFVVD